MIFDSNLTPFQAKGVDALRRFNEGSRALSVFTHYAKDLDPAWYANPAGPYGVARTLRVMKLTAALAERQRLTIERMQPIVLAARYLWLAKTSDAPCGRQSMQKAQSLLLAGVKSVYNKDLLVFLVSTFDLPETEARVYADRYQWPAGRVSFYLSCRELLLDAILLDEAASQGLEEAPQLNKRSSAQYLPLAAAFLVAEGYR